MTAKAKAKNREGLPTFDVTAEDSEHPGESKVFTFARRAMIQGDVLLSYFEDSADDAKVSAAIRDMIAASIHPDDRAAYADLVRSDRYIVSMWVLRDLAQEFASVYAARPSQPSLNS